MTKIRLLYDQFSEALSRIETVMELPQNEFIRDSAIKSFEFTFDLSWKLLKASLLETEAI